MPYQPGERKAHWVGLNHQNRIPSRWVAFDTEARRVRGTRGEVQTWRVGAAAKWRTDLRAGQPVGIEVFHTPLEMWQWVTEFCRPKQRTVVWAHNLGYDIRISDAMRILPELGWHLDWCNMSSNVSTMTWRGDNGTLTFTDSSSWLPMSLAKIGELVGIPKLAMPYQEDLLDKWIPYVKRDVVILQKAVSQLIDFVRKEDLGNWQPTGAGMAFATWRHKFMKHKVLVHADKGALDAERKAMHTGRAEAWRHGKLTGDTWVEIDLKQAYTRVARVAELPCKLKWHNGPITHGQYDRLKQWASVLAKVEVRTSVPCVPVYHRGRTVWPVGEFTTWLWDCELDGALAQADRVDIRECYIYTRAPILSEWAQCVFDVQERSDEHAPPVVRRYVKHSGRTLIGRIALRTAEWAVWGTNPDGEAGVSYQVESETGKVYRLMHTGDRTFREEARVEGHDSLPQITGYIMAMCRVWLWQAMQAAGEENIAHVDTDSLIVNLEGLRRLRKEYGSGFGDMWQIKAVYQKMTVHGPRNYRGDGIRKTAGIPVRAQETAENAFAGESWSSLARDMAEGRTDSVTVTDMTWQMRTKDPRRANAPGGRTRTRPIVIRQNSKPSSLDASTGTSGS